MSSLLFFSEKKTRTHFLNGLSLSEEGHGPVDLLIVMPWHGQWGGRKMPRHLGVALALQGKNTIIIRTGVKIHGQSCQFVEKITPLPGHNTLGVNSAYVLKSQG